MIKRKPNECCASCRYSHAEGDHLLCYGQRFAPRIETCGWCEGYKAKAVCDWTSPLKNLPGNFVSVQVYIPSQKPFPTVREGYVVCDQLGEPAYWFVPALAESFDLDAVDAWKPFEEPEYTIGGKEI